MAMAPERSDLVDAAAAGDEGAFRELVRRHIGLMWSIIRSYRLSSADGEDAAQGVWLLLVENLGRIQQHDRLHAWIAATTRHECLRILRRTSYERLDVSARLDEMASALAEFDRPMVVSERAKAVFLAIAELDTRCRELLALLGVDPALGYADIAEMLGIPLGTIGPTRQRCLEKVRRHRAVVRAATA